MIGEVSRIETEIDMLPEGLGLSAWRFRFHLPSAMTLNLWGEAYEKGKRLEVDDFPLQEDGLVSPIGTLLVGMRFEAPNPSGTQGVGVWASWESGFGFTSSGPQTPPYPLIVVGSGRNRVAFKSIPFYALGRVEVEPGKEYLLLGWTAGWDENGNFHAGLWEHDLPRTIAENDRVIFIKVRFDAESPAR